MKLSTTVLATNLLGYDYDETSPIGPPNWHLLNVPGENVCNGKSQSPIDIETTGCTLVADYDFDSGNCAFRDGFFGLQPGAVEFRYNFENCRRPIMRIPKPELEHENYTAVAFHIHTSSEHTFNGKFSAAELHIAHVNDAVSQFGVVAILLEPTSNENNPLFEKMLGRWTGKAAQCDEKYATTDATVAAVTTTTTTTSKAETTSLTETATTNGNATVAAVERGNGSGSGTGNGKGNRRHHGRSLQTTPTAAPTTRQFVPIYDLIPPHSTIFHYSGGQTTPPCAEVVWWNVVDNPLSISVSQYGRLWDLIVNYRDPENNCELSSVANQHGSTSRPPQPLNGRIVDRICPIGYDENMLRFRSSAICSISQISLWTIGMMIITVSLFL